MNTITYIKNEVFRNPILLLQPVPVYCIVPTVKHMNTPIRVTDYVPVLLCRYNMISSKHLSSGGVLIDYLTVESIIFNTEYITFV